MTSITIDVDVIMREFANATVAPQHPNILQLTIHGRNLYWCAFCQQEYHQGCDPEQLIKPTYRRLRVSSHQRFIHIHTNTYICQRCSDTYNTRLDLQRHTGRCKAVAETADSSVVTPDQTRLVNADHPRLVKLECGNLRGYFWCSTCRDMPNGGDVRPTAKASDMKRHALWHVGPNLYQCGQCERKFNSAKSVANHIRTHRRDFEQRITNATEVLSTQSMLMDMQEQDTLPMAPFQPRPTQWYAPVIVMGSHRPILKNPMSVWVTPANEEEKDSGRIPLPLLPSPTGQLVVPSVLEPAIHSECTYDPASQLF